MADHREPSVRIFNEEEFRHLLGREVQRATRYQDFLSLCLARASSPRASAAIARRAAEFLRSTDVVGLLDDMVAILLVHTPDNEAATIIERLRTRLEAEVFQGDPEIPAARSVLSLGRASFPTDATVDTTLVSHAHTRLTDAERARLSVKPGHD